jgi:hypothetical protein
MINKEYIKIQNIFIKHQIFFKITTQLLLS